MHFSKILQDNVAFNTTNILGMHKSEDISIYLEDYMLNYHITKDSFSYILERKGKY